jgi:hypothetical protein
MSKFFLVCQSVGGAICPPFAAGLRTGNSYSPAALPAAQLTPPSTLGVSDVTHSSIICTKFPAYNANPMDVINPRAANRDFSSVTQHLQQDQTLLFIHTF